MIPLAFAMRGRALLRYERLARAVWGTELLCRDWHMHALLREHLYIIPSNQKKYLQLYRDRAEHEIYNRYVVLTRCPYAF
jgi:hypothetical protein